MENQYAIKWIIQLKVFINWKIVAVNVEHAHISETWFLALSTWEKLNVLSQRSIRVIKSVGQKVADTLMDFEMILRKTSINLLAHVYLIMPLVFCFLTYLLFWVSFLSVLRKCGRVNHQAGMKKRVNMLLDIPIRQHTMPKDGHDYVYWGIKGKDVIH